MDDRTPQRFGRYEILGELGRGAMGVVYKARDPKINRIVAVKTISLAGQPPEDELDYRQRFFREAEAAGRISHPGIVTIFDVGEEPETRAPYIVMEFVNGEALDKLLSRDDRKLPVETALQLALEIAEALDNAHRQGVVHRDLKPANILITEDGHAKIADFGVAKLNLANQTLAGRALGTPAYMSPEQLNGETVDGRSDLFSLGVILYTVLTGYRPFQGNSAVTVSFKVVNHEPMPATLLNTAVPEGVDAIIARAMAKDPAERYQTGMEMVADIRKLQKERELGRRTQTDTATKTQPVLVQPSLGQPSLVQPSFVESTLSKPSFAEPAPDQPVQSQPAHGQSAPNQPAPSPTAMRPAKSGKATPGQAPPGQPQLVASKSSSRTRAFPPLPGQTQMQMQMHMKDMAAKIRKMSVPAVAVVAGLFILGLWFISLGPQGVQPRAAEPVHPAETASEIKPTRTTPTIPDANTIASLERTPATAAKEHTKAHKTDSRSTATASSANASASADRTAASASKELSKTGTQHKTDSAKTARPTVAEVSAPALPAVVPEATPALPTATLEIEVDHKFAEAQLSIWVDDTLSYTHELEGTAKKRLVVFHHVEGHELHAMQVSPGKHRLRVRVTSDDPTYDHSAFVTTDLTSGQEGTLRVTFNKHGDINLTLQ